VLEATGVVDALCFGSEHGSIAPFEAIANQLTRESGAFQAALHKGLDAGMRYPSAFAKAILDSDLAVDGYDPSKPNNTLGLFYTLAIARQGARMRPTTIARTGSGYSDVVPTHASIASATALRQLLVDGGPQAIAPFAPATTVEVLQREIERGRGLVTWDAFARPLFHQLATLPAAQLASIADMREGLENRLKKALLQTKSADFSSYVQEIATKRYTNTHLQRVLTNVLLNRKAESDEPATYIRVLGYTERGQQLLKTMRKSATAPVITRVNQEQFALLEDDFAAATAYALAFGAAQPDAIRRELTQSPVVVK
jgi:predicted nucleotidyltransferase